MIILTGADGFIGKKFLKRFEEEGKIVVKVEKNNSWHFRQSFNEWKMLS